MPLLGTAAGDATPGMCCSALCVLASPFPECPHLVQVLSLRGRVMLMMPSTSDDLPALWLPHTTTVGRSSVNCAPAARIMLTMLTSLLASCWYLEELNTCRPSTWHHHQYIMSVIL
jgi:hypothetical protein